MHDSLTALTASKIVTTPDKSSAPSTVSPADVTVSYTHLLATAFLTFFNFDKPIIFPDITYSFYKVWADVYRIPYEEIPLSEDFTINVADYNRECGGIVIANPNAPTGIVMSLDDIETIIKNNRCV